jgi:hypothetical protein
MRLRHWLLLAACIALAVVGPVMAWQELEHASRDDALAGLTGEQPETDPSFRAPGRMATLAAAGVVGLAGAWTGIAAVRVATVRSVSTRLLVLLVLGLLGVGLAYVVDVRILAEVSYRVRAGFVGWAYTAAAVVVGGSALRLAQIEDAFAP